MFIKIFLILSLLFICSLILGTCFLYKSKNLFIKDKSIAFSVLLMGLYIVCCFIGMFFADIPTKIILLLCGTSPFVIGEFATYQKIMFYTFVQILVISGGIVFVLCRYFILN